MPEAKMIARPHSIAVNDPTYRRSSPRSASQPVRNAANGYAIRYPPVGPSNRSGPGGNVADAANTGRPARPAARYRIWLADPRREPSASPPIRTTIGCSVSGTSVNGSGTLICAAAAVSAVKNSSDAIGTTYETPATSWRAVADVRTLSKVAEFVADIVGIVLLLIPDSRPSTSLRAPRA